MRSTIASAPCGAVLIVATSIILSCFSQLLVISVCYGWEFQKMPTTTKATTFAKGRRPFLTTFAGAVAAAVAPSIGTADDAVASATTRTQVDRNTLLESIANKESDEKVIAIIEQLQGQDPSQGRSIQQQPELLDGTWELIWSYKAEAFSPLLKLPKPFRPDSYQYFGSVAAQEVGEGRIAQGLTSGLLGRNQLWLSSGAIPLTNKKAGVVPPGVLEIQPPFRLQLGDRVGSNKTKRTIVEAGSDAEFRKQNARTKEAQMAGKNWYQQVYVETADNTGNNGGRLRISKVIAGDPVLVGEIFVHRKL